MTYFFDKLSKAVPEWMLVVLLLVLSIMAIIIFSRKGVLRIQLRRLLKVMFVEYIILLFCSTVVFREDFGHTGVRYTLFEKYLDNNMYLLKDALLNIVIFIPVGFCSSVFLRHSIFLKILLLSVALSCTIELSQYILARGWCDVNDVLNNTIGCTIGWSFYRMTVMVRYRG